MVTTKLLTEFCEVVNAVYGDSTDVSFKDTFVRTANAYKFTKDLVLLNRKEWLGNNCNDSDIEDYCNSIVTNILMDIFETGMYPETKEIILKALNKSEKPTEEECKKFAEDYYGDLAGELGLSKEQLNKMITMIA